MPRPVEVFYPQSKNLATMDAVLKHPDQSCGELMAQRIAVPYRQRLTDQAQFSRQLSWMGAGMLGWTFIVISINGLSHWPDLLWVGSLGLVMVGDYLRSRWYFKKNLDLLPPDNQRNRDKLTKRFNELDDEVTTLTTNFHDTDAEMRRLEQDLLGMQLLKQWFTKYQVEGLIGPEIELGADQGQNFNLIRNFYNI